MLFTYALLFYLLALFCIILYSFINIRFSKNIYTIFVLIGLLFNGAHIVNRWLSTKYFPTASLSDILIFLCFILISMSIFISINSKKPAMVSITLPFVLILGILSMIFWDEPNVKLYNNTFWLYIHLPSIIIGTAFLISSAFASIMYLYQEKRLRKKNLNLISEQIPPLEFIDKINIYSLIAGFVLFSLGLLSGIIWDFYEVEQYKIKAKVIFSVLTWIVFGLILFLKNKKGLPPGKSALWSIIGFLFIFITYFGVAIFLRGN